MKTVENLDKQYKDIVGFSPHYYPRYYGLHTTETIKRINEYGTDADKAIVKDSYFLDVYEEVLVQWLEILNEGDLHNRGYAEAGRTIGQTIIHTFEEDSTRNLNYLESASITLHILSGTLKEMSEHLLVPEQVKEKIRVGHENL